MKPSRDIPEIDTEDYERWLMEGIVIDGRDEWGNLD